MKNYNLLGTAVRAVRHYVGFSQEALGAQGFVSTPGWIKIEAGQRSASEKLIERFTNWLVADKQLSRAKATELREELLAAKYLDDPSPFVRQCVESHLAKLPALRNRIDDLRQQAAEAAKVARKRGRPARTTKLAKTA